MLRVVLLVFLGLFACAGSAGAATSPATQLDRALDKLVAMRGGPMGAMYELGALRALEEAVTGLNVNDAWSYVGVSAGSFIAACLANGLTMRQMLGSVARGDEGVCLPARAEIQELMAHADPAPAPP